MRQTVYERFEIQMYTIKQQLSRDFAKITFFNKLKNIKYHEINILKR